MSSQKTPPQTPPSDTVSRKSHRLELGTKRSYNGMQNRHSGEGRSYKKFKYTIQEVNGSTDTINESPNSDAAPNILAETVINAGSVGSAVDSCSVEKSLTNRPPAETAAGEMTAMSVNDHTNAESAISKNAPAGSLPPTEYAHWKRSVLDESGRTLEDVLEALKTQDTERMATAVPGVCPVFTDTEPTLPRIITGIGMNCVHTISASLASAIDIEKEKLQEHERNRLGQIKQDRNQMSLISGARLKKLEQFQAEEERLPGETKTAIACLSMRGIADRDLKDILCEPTELSREFTGQDEFESLIRGIERGNADHAKTQGRESVKETYCWPIIQRYASMIGPLPGLSGRKTGITPQEKYTAERLVKALGYGESRDSVLKARSYLKLLSDLREAGVTLLLLYRTKEFKTYFLRHPNELDMILSWNQVYHPCLSQLRLRAIAQAEGDFSGRCDLEDQDIFHRLHILQGVLWSDDLCEWGASTEKESYLAGQNIKPVSGKSNTQILRHGIQDDVDGNKSIYVNMIPFEGISGKKTLGGKSPSAKLLAVSPLVSVSPGDFLGIFPGKLRYTETWPAGAIHGPAKGLWLDRSDVKGKLHWIRGAKTGERTNVCLVWEGVNEDESEKTFCQFWRILVVATRHIMPLDQLLRPV